MNFQQWSYILAFIHTENEHQGNLKKDFYPKVEITPDREVGTILFGAVGAMGTAAAAAVCSRDS